MPLRLPVSVDFDALTPVAPRRRTGRAGVVHAVDQRGQHVELLGVLVLGHVVLARDRAEHLLGDLARLLGEDLELLG